jgi:hypothetical protein
MVVPELMNLFNQNQQAIPTQLNSLQSMIQGGMNSPLLQQVLGPAMQRLQQPQADQRRQLTDTFRASGGLRGSSYGNETNKLMVNQGQQQNDLMAQVIREMLAPLIQGQMQEQQNSFLPARAMTDLFNAARPTVIGGFPPAGNASSSINQGGNRSIASGMLPHQGLPDSYGNSPGMLGPNAVQPGMGGVGGVPQAPQAPGSNMGDMGGSNIVFNPQTGFYESQSTLPGGTAGAYGQLSYPGGAPQLPDPNYGNFYSPPPVNSPVYHAEVSTPEQNSPWDWGNFDQPVNNEW